MKRKIMVLLLILTLVALTLLTKVHVKNLVAVEPGNNPILLCYEEVYPSVKNVSKSMFFGETDQVREKPQERKKLLQIKPPQKPLKVEIGELPLILMNVEQVGATYYLYKIRLKATLVPRPGVTAAEEAVKNIKNKLVYFLIDGIYVGKATASPSAYFEISSEETLKYRFRPGGHRIMALAAHDEKIIMGEGTLNVDIGRVKIQETTIMPSNIYFGYEDKNYAACHSEGDTITVSAKFTDINHPDVPVVGAKVYFRNHAVVLSEARTDKSGEALFSYELTRASMLPSKHTWTFHEGRPLSIVQSDFNFFIEENNMYNETTDWGLVYRTMCACPQGYTRSKSDRTCIKK